jgi:hypothetical protein
LQLHHGIRGWQRAVLDNGRYLLHLQGHEQDRFWSESIESRTAVVCKNLPPTSRWLAVAQWLIAILGNYALSYSTPIINKVRIVVYYVKQWNAVLAGRLQDTVGLP